MLRHKNFGATLFATALQCRVIRYQLDNAVEFIVNNNMEVSSAAVFLNMVNSFTDADQLMDFAATWGIQDSPAVRLRLYQLRNTNDWQSLPTVDRSIQQNVALESVRTQEEVEESIKALLFDEEMDTLGQSCIDDGEREPMIQVNWFSYIVKLFIYYLLLKAHV